MGETGTVALFWPVHDELQAQLASYPGQVPPFEVQATLGARCQTWLGAIKSSTQTVLTQEEKVTMASDTWEVLFPNCLEFDNTVIMQETSSGRALENALAAKFYYDACINQLVYEQVFVEQRAGIVASFITDVQQCVTTSTTTTLAAGFAASGASGGKSSVCALVLV